MLAEWEEYWGKRKSGCGNPKGNKIAKRTSIEEAALNFFSQIPPPVTTRRRKKTAKAEAVSHSCGGIEMSLK